MHAQTPNRFQPREMFCSSVSDEVVVQEEMHERGPGGTDKCDDAVVSDAVMPHPYRRYVCGIETTHGMNAPGRDAIVEEVKGGEIRKVFVTRNDVPNVFQTSISYFLTTHVKGQFASEHCVTV